MAARIMAANTVKRVGQTEGAVREERTSETALCMQLTSSLLHNYLVYKVNGRSFPSEHENYIHKIKLNVGSHAKCLNSPELAAVIEERERSNINPSG